MMDGETKERKFRGHPVIHEPYDLGYPEIYYLKIGEEIINLTEDNNGDLQLDFSHSVLVCKKCGRFCDYEYLTCPCDSYVPSTIASRAELHGHTIYHCQNGNSTWLNHEDAKKLRPERCAEIEALL